MRSFLGNNHNFILTETDNGSGFDISYSFDALTPPPLASSTNLFYRVVGSGADWTSVTLGTFSPQTTSIPPGNYEYAVRINYIAADSEFISFEVHGSLYIPELNPILFFLATRSVTDRYQTKHFDQFMFGERVLPWQEMDCYMQLWQTTDIIKLQITSTFSSNVINVLDENGGVVYTITLAGGIENLYVDGASTFDVAIPVAAISAGVYRLQLVCNLNYILYSDWQYFSAVPVENTVLFEYKHIRYHKDVIFETGILFQFRVAGTFGALDKVRKDEKYKNEPYDSILLSSRSSKQWPWWFGDERGLPDDVINLIDEIFGCSYVLLDGKQFTLSEKPDYIEADNERRFPKRGMKLILEETNNKNSRVFIV